MADYESVLLNALRSADSQEEGERQKTYRKAIAAVVRQLDGIPGMPVEMKERQLRLLEKAIGSVEVQLASHNDTTMSMREVAEIMSHVSMLRDSADLDAMPSPSPIISRIALTIILAMATVFGFQFTSTLMGRTYSWDDFFSLFGVGVGFLGLITAVVVQAIKWKRS